jgi:hypothetical protein
MDILAWIIDPELNQSGFSPHRDRQPEIVSDSFDKDGKAKYMTAWIAISEVISLPFSLYLDTSLFSLKYDKF